ncbi:PAS domain S-box protein [Thermodesulfobacteriota bacterium]
MSKKPTYEELEKRIKELEKKALARSRTEDALRESEEKYRLLIDNLPNIVFKGYKDGSIDFIDDQIELLTGYNKEEFNLRKINWLDIVVEEDKEKIRQTFIEALKTDKSYVREYRIKTKTGDVIWIQEGSQIICDENREIKYISGAFLDITERKQIEIELKESNIRYTSLVDQSPISYEVYDKDGLLVRVNKAFEELWGVKAEDAVEKFNIKTDPQAEALGIKPFVARAYRGESVKPPETCWDPGKSGFPGRPRWLNTRIYPIKDNMGEVTNVIIVHEDITERKKAEDTLRESEEKFRTFMETASDYMFIADSEGNFTYVNDSLVKKFGYTKNEMVGMNITSLLPEQTVKDKFKPKLKELILKESVSFEDNWITRDGKDVVGDLRIVAVYDDDKQFVGGRGVFHDITDRKLAEANLRESEERFREVAANINEIIWLFDWNKQKVIYVSPAYERIWGRSIENLYKKYDEWAESIHPDDVNYARESFQKVLESGAGLVREYRIVQPDGSVRWISDNSFPIFDDDRQIVRITGIAEDITDRKMAEEALQFSLNRFRIVMDSLAAAVYVADIKTYELLFLNKFAQDIWGDVVGQTCWKVLQSGQTGPCAFCTNEKLVDDDGQPAGVYDWEFQNTLDNEWYDCRDQAIQWADGRIVRMEIATNITKRKQAERELRASESIRRGIRDFKRRNRHSGPFHPDFCFNFIPFNKRCFLCQSDDSISIPRLNEFIDETFIKQVFRHNDSVINFAAFKSL